MSVDIVVRKRTRDFQAFLADNEGVWESGKSATEAVGKLAYSAQRILGISIAAEISDVNGGFARQVATPKRITNKALHLAIRELYATKGKIDAIKYLREQRHLGLKEALDYVDKLLGK